MNNMSRFQTSHEDISYINNNNSSEDNIVDMKTKEVDLLMVNPNKICDYCLMMKNSSCMVFFIEQVKICEECLVRIIKDKIFQFPNQSVKLINGKRVFFLTVKSHHIKLYFNGIFKILPDKRKKEIQDALSQQAMQLSSDIDNYCMVCGELIKLIDSNVMIVKIDNEYNDKMNLFKGNNYNTKNHLVCFNCYKTWLDQTITLHFQGSLDIMSMCALCKGVEHKCTYKGDIKKLKWYDDN